MNEILIIFIFLLELTLTALIIYFTTKFSGALNYYTAVVKELHQNIPDLTSQLRCDLKNFNKRINSKNKPYSSQELGYMSGRFSVDLLKFCILTPPSEKPFTLFRLFFHIWKNRNKLISTINQYQLQSVNNNKS